MPDKSFESNLAEERLRPSVAISFLSWMKPFRVSERRERREEAAAKLQTVKNVLRIADVDAPLKNNHRVKRRKRSTSPHPAHKWQKIQIMGAPFRWVNPCGHIWENQMGHPVHLLLLHSFSPDIIAEQRLWSEQFLASCTSLISLIHLPSLIPFGPPHHKFLWSDIARTVITG